MSSSIDVFEGRQNSARRAPPPYANSSPINEKDTDPISNEEVKEKVHATSDTLDPEEQPRTDEDHIEPDLRDYPPEVRNTVSFEDDPTLPTITFRYFLLTFLFTAPGAFLYQMGQFRTTAAPYSVFFVQIASHYAGVWLAKVLPSWEVKIPFTRFKFNLNPGPWSIKEHVLVTISAASGATSNAGSTPISLAQLYYNEKIPAAACIFFMWAIVFIGYSLAAVARQFLLYDPIYAWPQALMQTSLFETYRKSDANSRTAKKQRNVFVAVLLFVILWEFLPEYAFPMLSSLSFLCWVASENPTANFIGAGIGGMGFLNLTLDWSNISNGTFSNPMVAPFWTSVVIFVGYVFNCWVLLPIAKWGKLGDWQHQIMSNKLFLENGTAYPTLDLIGPGNTFNQTAYDQYGPAFMGTQEIWALFFDYSSYTSAMVWMLLFGWPQLRNAVSKLRARARAKGTESINAQYSDRLNVIQRAYKEVPLWWYLVLFSASFVIIITILAKSLFFIPIWTFIVALLFAFIIVIPMGWLYAISNFQVAIGSTNELMYGYMVNAISGHKHPAGASTYGAIAGDAWYRAQYMLQDQKIGHYMHIPPREVFFSQIFGELIGVPINYGVIQWVLEKKGDYLLGITDDPLGQWSGKTLASYNSMGVQYVVIGPARLFKEHIFEPLPYGFLFGALAPCAIYALHRFFPRVRFDLWNLTIFASAMSYFYGYLSTGFTSRTIVAYFSMYFFFRYRFETWKRYNYLVAAALDAGFNISMLLIFVIFSSGKVIAMPNWWGNNAVSVERCFASQDS